MSVKNTSAEISPPRRASDNLCKRLAEQYPAQVAQWLFGVNQVALEKTELQRTPIHADAVVFSHNRSETLHAEFQTTLKSKPPVPLRMLDYYVGLKRQHPRRRIRQVLVVLKPTDQPVPDRYEADDTLHRYRVIKLWEVDPQELLKHEGLLPLATLCHAESGEQLLAKVATRIKRIKSPQLRRETLNASRMLAGLRYDADLIRRILQTGDIMKESVIYQEIFQEGKQLGFTEGQQEGKRELAIQMLEWRFGKLPVEARQQLAQLAVGQIKTLCKASLKFKTINELTAWLTQHVTAH